VNKRGRLVYVAKEAGGWGAERAGVTCVIDADFDVLTEAADSSVLLRTDFAALENYTLLPRPFAKFMGQFVEGSWDPESTLRELLPIWTYLFVLRYVLHRHSDGESLLKNFASKCVSRGKVVGFSARMLIQGSISGNAVEVGRLVQLYEEQVALVGAPSLATVRGHDIAAVLIHFFGLKGDLRSADQVERLMRACVEVVDLEGQPMFRALERRVLGS